MASDEEKIGQSDMERWLDTALRARIDAEPRAGLEDRVLARLASEPRRRRFPFWPVMIAVAAILILAVTLVLFRTNKSQPNVAIGSQEAAKRSTATAEAQRTPPVLAQNKPEGQRDRAHVARRGAACCVSAKTVASTAGYGSKLRHQKLPMLATFPAVSPETQEEHLLAYLVAHAKFVDFAPLQDRPLPQFTIHPMDETQQDESPQE